ncbi:MAG: Cfr10I/Bse634I family restriction endonuclease [Dehalococcoidia bacterium]|jgi:hypothetical protein
MSLIRILHKNTTEEKPQIIKDEAFCQLLHNVLPETNKSFERLFNEFDAVISAEDDRVTEDAKKNAHGNWYEWLIALSAWNLFARNVVNYIALPLPNITQFDVARLYEENLYELILDLRGKIVDSTNVELISSNPDFVIIDGTLAREVLDDIEEIDNITTENITRLQTRYLSLVHRCSFDQIIGYISVKFSLRPDRRLQIPHEGSLMKAIYVHLQTRNWIINPDGLKYYAISKNVTDADRRALRTVATHSITTVQSLPQAAVDEVFEVNTLATAETALTRILVKAN